MLLELRTNKILVAALVRNEAMENYEGIIQLEKEKNNSKKYHAKYKGYSPIKDKYPNSKFGKQFR